jgi:hypothetical protein
VKRVAFAFVLLAACASHTTTVRFAAHGIAFDHPQAWRVRLSPADPRLVVQLRSDDVRIDWYDGPKGRVAKENLRVGGQPAHKTYWPNGCPGVGDEMITVRFDNPSRTTTYTMNACLRGPRVRSLRKQVDAMLRSVRFS